MMRAKLACLKKCFYTAYATCHYYFNKSCNKSVEEDETIKVIDKTVNVPKRRIWHFTLQYVFLKLLFRNKNISVNMLMRLGWWGGGLDNTSVCDQDGYEGKSKCIFQFTLQDESVLGAGWRNKNADKSADSLHVMNSCFKVLPPHKQRHLVARWCKEEKQNQNVSLFWLCK